MPIWSGILNVALIWRKGGAYGTMCPTYSVESNTPLFEDMHADITTAMQALDERLAEVIDSDAENVGAYYRTLSGNINLNGVGEFDPFTGLRDPSGLPNYVSVLLRKHVFPGDVYTKGRMYLCFPGKDLVFNEDVAVDDAVLLDVCEAVADTITQGGTTLTAVVANKATGGWDQVSSVTPGPYVTHRKWRTVAHQQSRL